MVQKQLTIHTENILPIIKKWLYSDKDIFIRELISNACDALSKLEILREQGVCEVLDTDLKIELTLDPVAKTLTFADTGIGMSAEEVEKYIAQVAFSGAEEFLSKYTSHKEKDQIIGHFGLGFYSSYMVAKEVSLDTLSYLLDSKPALWKCDGSSTYTLEEGSRTSRGTTITLYLAEGEDEYLKEDHLRDILKKYCSFLPYPISLNGTPINEKEPLFLKNPTQCTKEEYLEFYHTLYPLEADPIFWVHINVDYPFHLQGILYFPKLSRQFDWQKSELKLFCNRVFVSDSCKDLLPDYLTCLRGALDSPDIPLNVSRSSLQMDKTVRQLASHISKKVASKLTSLYETEKESFLKAWPDIELIVKLGMLQDEKFYEQAKNCLIWKTLDGNWITLEDHLAKHPDKVFYTQDPSSPLLSLYNKENVLISTSPIDTSLMQSLERKLKITFQRLDGALDEKALDPTREKTVLDSEGKTEAGKIADLCRSVLSEEALDIEAKSLSSDEIPALLLLKEEARRMRDYFSITQQEVPSHLFGKRQLILNTNNKLVTSLLSLKEKNPDLAKEVVWHIYELTLLAQKEFNPELLSRFVTRSTKVLDGLVG